MRSGMQRACMHVETSFGNFLKKIVNLKCFSYNRALYERLFTLFMNKALPVYFVFLNVTELTMVRFLGACRRLSALVRKVQDYYRKIVVCERHSDWSSKTSKKISDNRSPALWLNNLPLTFH